MAPKKKAGGGKDNAKKHAAATTEEAAQAEADADAGEADSDLCVVVNPQDFAETAWHAGHVGCSAPGKKKSELEHLGWVECASWECLICGTSHPRGDHREYKMCHVRDDDATLQREALRRA